MKQQAIRNRRVVTLLTSLLALFAVKATSGAAVPYAGEFAPGESWAKPQEAPCRASVCLNGNWQFQPVAVPASYVRNQGNPPDLPLPRSDAWEQTPLEVPSPWNVNTWGNGRNVGAGTAHPYWPDSVYYPSYPKSWDTVEMAWMRRAFTVPADWQNRRIILHFEAVAGDCRVLINGKPAGHHFDAYLPFELDITNLVSLSGANELLVGVRARRLFDEQSPRYAKMRCPYPTGSNTAGIAGIWQDVYQLAVPAVRVADIFAKPLVDQSTLELELTLKNNTDLAQPFSVDAQVSPWINQATAAQPFAPKWELGQPAFSIGDKPMTLAARAEQKVTLRRTIAPGELEFWAPGTPNPYMAVVSLQQDGKPIDRHLTGSVSTL